MYFKSTLLAIANKLKYTEHRSLMSQCKHSTHSLLMNEMYKNLRLQKYPFTHDLTFHAFSYLWSSAVSTYLVENSEKNNPKLLNLKPFILNSRMKSVLLFCPPGWEASFTRYTQAVHHLPDSQICTELPREQSQHHRASAQGTLLL